MVAGATRTVRHGTETSCLPPISGSLCRRRSGGAKIGKWPGRDTMGSLLAEKPSLASATVWQHAFSEEFERLHDFLMRWSA
jgi:hypothetical protein